MRGSCLCAAVVYEIDAPIKLFQYCHCSRCRKISGSAHASNIYLPLSQFRWIQGEEHLARFEHPTAKYYATSFCKVCGANLPWRVKNGETVIVPAGTLDEDPGIQPLQCIHWASRASWYLSPDCLQKHDELPPRSK